MPTYTFTAPDGKRLKVTAPEGATEEQAFSKAKEMYAQQQAQSQQIQMQPLNYPITKGSSVAEDFGSLEAPLTMATGAAGAIAGGIRGLAELDPLNYMNPPTQERINKATKAIKDTQQAMTYQPRTESGKQGLQNIANFAKPLTDVMTKAETEMGEMGYKKHGPMGGAIASTLPTAYTMMLGPALSNLGKGMKDWGAMSALKKKRAFTQELVSPRPKYKQRVKGSLREEDLGRFRGTRVKPTKEELAYADEIATVKGVSPSKSIHRNIAALNKEKDVRFAEIGKKLDDIETPIQKSASMADPGNAVKKMLDDDPMLVGMEKQANMWAARAREFIADNPPTARGLWEARKQFDAYAEAKVSTMWTKENPTAAGAHSIVRGIRDSMNSRIASVAPQYADDMARSSNLLSARLNVAEKAANVSRSAFVRGVQNAAGMIGLRNELMQGMAVLTGTSVLGAATAFAPAISAAVAGVGGVIGAGRVITAPQTRMILGQTIRAIGLALGKAKDQKLISQLKADRAILIDTLQLIQDDEVIQPQPAPQPAPEPQAAVEPDLTGRMISYDVELEDTGETVEVTEDANEGMGKLRSRMDALTRVLEMLDEKG